MRKLGLLLALLVGGAALAAGAVTLDTSVRKEFTNCPSGGSAAQTLTYNTRYIMRITDADSFVCFASASSTCASGGEKFPAGMAMLIYITSDSKSVSCRSGTSTGDVIFTKAD